MSGLSISSDLTRIQNAKSSLATSITNKGVTVPPGTKIDGFAALVDQISGGGGSGLDYETGTYTPVSDTVQPTINFSKTHTSMPVFIYLQDAGGYNSTSNSNYIFLYIDWQLLIGNPIYTNSSTVQYGMVWYEYRGSSSASKGQTFFTVPSSDTDGSSASKPRYYATESHFEPYSVSTSRYWRAGRTYKWIAVWA